MSEKPLLMLIEDSRLYRQQLISLCQRNSYDYVTAEDGIQAIEMLFTLRPDLILLDIQLPGMNGYDVCRQIRKMPSIHQTPIIFLTSSDSEKDIVCAFNAGGNDFVSKPFNEIVLHSRIKNQLDQVNIKKILNHHILEMEKINKALKAEKEHSQHLASRDHLTGIYNRRYIQNTIIETIREHSKNSLTFSLALFDVDNFKNVNDTYGHTIGDYVLKEVVSIIYQNIREEDILGRWGGEEFILFMPFTTSDQAEPVVDGIRERVADHIFNAWGTTFNLTITCGLSEYDSTDDYNGIFNRIDEALYDGKNSGKNRVIIR